MKGFVIKQIPSVVQFSRAHEDDWGSSKSNGMLVQLRRLMPSSITPFLHFEQRDIAMIRGELACFLVVIHSTRYLILVALSLPWKMNIQVLTLIWHVNHSLFGESRIFKGDARIGKQQKHSRKL